jgi:hypothetical protein
MKSVTRLMMPGLAALVATALMAQAPTPPAPEGSTPGAAVRAPAPRLSADALARLQEGRIAMAKSALRLNDEQLKLWAPVEQQVRAMYAARQSARDDRRQRREQGAQGAQPAPLPDRLERVSEAMVQRAERMKALAAALKPLYATFSQEQKAVAGPVFRELLTPSRGGWRHHRFAATRGR